MRELFIFVLLFVFNFFPVLSVLRKLKQQAREALEERRPTLIQALRDIGDFYLELKWDFHSWGMCQLALKQNTTVSPVFLAKILRCKLTNSKHTHTSKFPFTTQPLVNWEAHQPGSSKFNDVYKSVIFPAALFIQMFVVSALLLGFFCCWVCFVCLLLLFVFCALFGGGVYMQISIFCFILHTGQFSVLHEHAFWLVQHFASE